jgi:molecular chaperone HtpG
MENHSFQADAKQILRLVTHSIYSEREVFLRELLSNASDALDKSRFVSLREGDFRTVENPSIHISFDEENKVITIEDDGIGMTRDEVIENLGTIAQSGTKKFLEGLDAGDKLENLIGQFGVGFYSSFMVADKVEVETLSIHKEATAIKWISDGGDGYSIEDGNKESRGTKITLYLREDAQEFADDNRLRSTIKKHSSFIQSPILMGEERINEEKAIWARNPSEVTEEEYNEFYKHITGDWQEPMAHLHFSVEGSVTFNAVLFIPQKHSLQLENMNYKVDLRLFQKRIQVIEHANDLLPQYLRFVCGVVDSPDVELNVSREILQQTKTVDIIKKQITKRILRKLQEISEEENDKYNTFWEDMGIILKGGIPEDAKFKDNIVELFRCKTTTYQDNWRSLRQIKEEAQEGQEEIWHLTNVTSRDNISSLPVLEGFKKRNWEVMLLTDPVDEWVTMSVPEYDGMAIKSVSQGNFDEEEETEETKEDKTKAVPLVDWLSTLLEDEVEEVRISNRLTESPSVLVDKEGGMSSNLQNIMNSINPNSMMPDMKRVLEINPSHPLVKTLAGLNEKGTPGLEPFARLLLDHAMIVEGQLKDPTGFAKRLQGLMEKAAIGL